MKTIKWYAQNIFRSGLTVISPKLNNAVTYRIKFKRKLDLKNPKTFNEKILWLKFNDYLDNPVVKQCADKLRVREYIEKQGCPELLNELIGYYDNVEQIDWDALPQQFALKLNVGCACNIIVSDRSQLNIEKTKEIMKKWLASNYWLGWAEMQYKDVKPYILIEKYLGTPDGALPEDFKFYCMNGVCKTIMVCKGRDASSHKAKYFFMDRDWNLLPYTQEALDEPDIVIERPPMLSLAMKYAEKLSSAFPFVRADFYLFRDKVIFGELTFTPAGAMDTDLILTPPGMNESVDVILGEMLDLKN